MAAYNPNAVWESKEKKYEYTAPGTEPPPPTNPTGGSDQPSFFRRHGLIFFTIGIVLLIGFVALVYYLLLPPPTPNVAITFSEPPSIMIGKPFPLTIAVANDSKSVLQNGELNISLPDGLSFAGEDPTQRVAAEPIGTLSSQTINPTTTVQVVASPSVVGTSQTIGVKFVYQTASTAATQFQTTANTSITVGTEPAIALSYDAPSSIFSGQNFDIVVHYANNTSEPLNGIQFTSKFPPAYHFVGSSSTAPTGASNNTWSLGSLDPNATGTLVITGNIVGPDQAKYEVPGSIGANFLGQTYPAAIQSANFVLTPSPLSLTIALNNTSTYITKLGDTLSYALTYKNNSNVTFQSVNVSATLTGSMYDLASLKTDGSFNSQSNTITWYAANTPALIALAPGASGVLSFTVGIKPSFPIRLPSDKNYIVLMTAKATSPTVPPNTAGANTTSVNSLTTKIGGMLSFVSDGFYKEASTTITNTGPYPPKVNQPTQYTIHWTIRNYSTDAQNVTVSAYLQSGSTFTGAATNTGLASTTSPVYNAGTGQITWTVPFIPATTGVISPPVQTVFQITNTPAVNQVGQAVTLLGPATLTATDVYTNAPIQLSDDAVTTRLSDDPSTKNMIGNVTQ